MKRVYSVLLVISFILIPFLSAQPVSRSSPVGESWKAGVARVKITPQEPVWLAGYASRKHPSEGKLDDLWAKALALEDAQGNQALLITSDLIGFPKELSDSIRNSLGRKFNLPKSRIILNSSHTHSGPVLRKSLVDIYPMSPGDWEKIDRYSENLVKQIVEMGGKVLRSMKPARLYSGNGVTRFQVNRRNNNEKLLADQTELKGPNDYAVPVIKVASVKGDLMAVAFGYACHATVLNGYQVSGDYPGFAQAELEKRHPGAEALFFQGTGADQNPIPRRSPALAQQYGGELALAVDRVLNEEMKELSPAFSAAYSEVVIELDTPPSTAKLKKMAADTASYQQRWATRLLDEISRGKSWITSYPYPVQIWRIGEQNLVAMGGEVVIDYTLKLKQMLGSGLIVLGYSNDVMSYIPSARVLKEGGYESETSQIAFGMPARWKPTVEGAILKEVATLAGQLNISERDNLLAKAEMLANENNFVASVKVKSAPLIAKHFFSGFDEAHDTYNAISAASDGKIYYVLSSQLPDKGGQMFVYDPKTDKTRFLADLTDICGEKGKNTIAQGKSHVRFYENNGKIWFATHVGYYEIIDGMERLPVNAPQGMKLYPGGHILSYDVKTGRFADQGIAIKGEGILTMTMDHERNQIYALSWPSGYFIRYDMDGDKFYNLGKVSLNGEAGNTGNDYRVLCRAMFVDNRDGCVYFSVPEGDIYRYKTGLNVPEKVDNVNLRLDYFGKYDPSDPGSMGYNWRAISWFEPEGVAYGVHGNSGYLFRFDPGKTEIEIVDRITSGPSRKSGMFDQFSYGYLGFQLGPDGETLYYLTGGPVYINGKRVKGLDEINMGAAKGLEDLHLITYNLRKQEYIDHGPVFYENGGRPTYVNSIAIGSNGDVYTLARFEHSGKVIEDLVKIPNPFLRR